MKLGVKVFGDWDLIFGLLPIQHETEQTTLKYPNVMHSLLSIG